LFFLNQTAASGLADRCQCQALPVELELELELEDGPSAIDTPLSVPMSDSDGDSIDETCFQMPKQS
jgi:hypothetical protein